MAQDEFVLALSTLEDSQATGRSCIEIVSGTYWKASFLPFAAYVCQDFGRNDARFRHLWVSLPVVIYLYTDRESREERKVVQKTTTAT